MGLIKVGLRGGHTLYLDPFQKLTGNQHTAGRKQQHKAHRVGDKGMFESLEITSLRDLVMVNCFTS